MSNEACGPVRDHLHRLGAVGGEATLPDCVHLNDLTTAGTFPNYTNAFDWGGLDPKTHDWGVLEPYKSIVYKSRLHAEGAEKQGVEKKVPGLQIEGYFSNNASETTGAPGNFFGNKKYAFDSQFVIRFPDPDHWQGRLVITGPPGNRGQYANDFIIGDHVLQKGCAFASTDKGNSGFRFYGGDQEPGDAMAEWNRQIEQLARVIKEVTREYYGHYGKELKYTYVTGCSNGGYLTRYALEKTPELYDGGVDWQGPLWTDPDGVGSDPVDKGPNLLTFLPKAITYYPLYPLRDARNAMIRAGFEPDQDFLWEYYYTIYWNLTQRIYREEFDPYYGGNDAEYNYADRISPQKNPSGKGVADAIKGAVKSISLTGDIQKPLITLHGTLDALLPIKKTSDKYAELVEKAGRSEIHRYYRIEGGTHLEGLYDYLGPDPINNPDYKLREKFREKLRPMLPCYKAAFDRLVEWVEEKKPPPKSQTVPKPEGHVVNSCSELKSQE